jgi:hypothetical protein
VGQYRTVISECGTVPDSDSDVGQCWRVISVCGTVPDSGAEGRTVLGSATEIWTVLESATEGGTVLDSASERGMGTMGAILCYNFSDVTMSHYGKILSLLMGSATCRAGSRAVTMCGIREGR